MREYDMGNYDVERNSIVINQDKAIKRLITGKPDKMEGDVALKRNGL